MALENRLFTGFYTWSSSFSKGWIWLLMRLLKRGRSFVLWGRVVSFGVEEKAGARSAGLGFGVFKGCRGRLGIVFIIEGKTFLAITSGFLRGCLTVCILFVGSLASIDPSKNELPDILIEFFLFDSVPPSNKTYHELWFTKSLLSSDSGFNNFLLNFENYYTGIVSFLLIIALISF